MWKRPIKQEGDACRRCGAPVVWREPKVTPAKLKKAYYYKKFLFCPNCKTMYMQEEYRVWNEEQQEADFYADGYCIGQNPSQDGGYTVCDIYGNVVAEDKFHGRSITNNEMELRGLLAAFSLCTQGQCVSTDSMNNIHWIKSGRSKARPDLNPIIKEAKNLMEERNLAVRWDGRDHNLAGHYNEITYNA